MGNYGIDCITSAFVNFYLQFLILFILSEFIVEKIFTSKNFTVSIELYFQKSSVYNFGDHKAPSFERVGKRCWSMKTKKP